MTEDRHQGRDECDRNPQRDEDGQRHSRAEGAEELELPRDEGGRAAGDDQARGEDDRQILSRRPVGSVEPFVARVEPLPHSVQEENRIVRDHAKQEYDENRLGVARDGHAQPLAEPGDTSKRDDVGDSGSGERHDGHDGRAEVHAEDQRDHENGCKGDPGQTLFDLPPLLHSGRNGPGDADQRVILGVHVLLGEAPRQIVLVFDVRLGWVEEEIGDRRRARFSRRRDEPPDVRDRQRRLHLRKLRVSLVRDQLRPARDSAKRLLGKALGVPLDDMGVRDDGDREELRRPDPCLD